VPFVAAAMMGRIGRKLGFTGVAASLLAMTLIPGIEHEACRPATGVCWKAGSAVLECPEVTRWPLAPMS
jgi:hypothetical protein